MRDAKAFAQTKERVVMGLKFIAVAAVAVACTIAPARAQDQKDEQIVSLPTLDVWASRPGGGVAALPGASSSVITAQDIERSSTSSLPDILAERAGIQVQHVIGGTNGSRDVVDMRGFGATATSNVLVLVNGRRFNDFDLQGFDFSAIPLNSIERIEIIRGNTGAVLYGDGAVGGVINIVTKTGIGQRATGRVEAAFGSFNLKEGRASAAASSGPFSIAANVIGTDTDGYRQNSALRQRGAALDMRYTVDQGSVYFNFLADEQKQGLPGGRTVDPSIGLDQVKNDPRGAATPGDYGNKQGKNFLLGFTRMLGSGVELIVDGSYRRKDQQGELLFLGVPFNAVDSTIETASITPRLKIGTRAFGLPLNILTGFDYYNTQYHSDRSQDFNSRPYHIYDIRQTTAGFYGNGTLAVRPDTDITVGIRLQRNTLSARDNYDPTAPACCLDAEGIPLDRSEWKQAWQVGFEHRFNPALAVFGHVAQSFRVPNADERIGQAPTFVFPAPIPTNFSLKTQTSREIEIGFRGNQGPVSWQISAYDMHLEDEIFFSAASGTNVNLDPTRRYGVESEATYRVLDNLRLKGGLAYTRTVFTEGPFTGNDVPLVSRWSGFTGLSWDIWQRYAVYDVVVRYAGERVMDNDFANTQKMIPARAIVDMRVGGEVKNFFWSFTVQNVFDDQYYDYAIASPFTAGRFSAYPQPGRTYMFRAGAQF
jgi:iron complex outermembrane receptor protein